MEQNTENPSFWSVLPAVVRYHTELSNFDKLMYTEITALSNKHGYCFAPNSYFMEVYQVAQSTVTRAITNLEKNGFLRVEGRNGEGRKMYPLTDTPKQKSVGGVSKNDYHNNTSNNNTSILYTNVYNTNTVKSLPLEGKSSLQRVIKFYSLLWQERYGMIPAINYPRAGKTLKPLLDELGELRVALAMLQYFSWSGATGNDSFLEKRLNDNTHPLYWLPDHTNAILAYIKNVLKLDVTDDKLVEKTLTRKLSDLGAATDARQTSQNAQG